MPNVPCIIVATLKQTEGFSKFHVPTSKKESYLDSLWCTKSSMCT